MIKTLRLKVKPEAYPWLNKAAVEVNQVWNFCNERSASVLGNLGKWLSGFDLCYQTAGSYLYMDFINAGVIQRICIEFAQRRVSARKRKLRWRVSFGSRRSLGWVPFKADYLQFKNGSIKAFGKTFRVFEQEKLEGITWKQGCFAQDSVGDWWLCLPVEVQAEESTAPLEAVGIDLGLKETAVTSDGDRLQAGNYFRNIEQQIAQAQRRGHKRQAKRLHRKAKNRRKDALHKFSRKLVNQYQTIVIGDVSSSKLVKTNMAKSVLDSGWGMLKRFLQYKGEHAGRIVKVINEAFTTRACSACGALTGPTGRTGLVVREWRCSECGTEHDRDVNAAVNIRNLGLRCEASVSGNELGVTA